MPPVGQRRVAGGVRITPESRRQPSRSPCPKCATKRLMLRMAPTTSQIIGVRCTFRPDALKQASLESDTRRLDVCQDHLLLPHHANHRRTGVDHIEFTGRCAAQVDYSALSIRTTVCDANHDRLAVVMVSDQHPSSKRQCAMGGGKPVWAGDLSACRSSAAVERGAPRFSVNRRGGYRHQNDGNR